MKVGNITDGQRSIRSGDDVVKQSEQLQLPPAKNRFSMPHVRWWIIAPLIVLSTTLNSLDRNVLSIAAPLLQETLGFGERKYAWILNAFMVSYMLMHLGFGRLIDYFGSRVGFALAVGFWSISNMLHGFATGWKSMAFYRCLLGAGEGGNYPAAIKTIGEWFPARERTIMTGVMNFGAGFGSMAAPILTAYLMIQYSWQTPFVVTGLIGFVWIALWLWLYKPPELHPWVRPQEREVLRADRNAEAVEPQPADKNVFRTVLRTRNIWGVAIARFFTEQPWSFIMVWFPTYLVNVRGLDLKGLAMYAWMPFLASDIGCLSGGFLSPWFRKLGLPLLTARKVALTIPCCLMTVLLFAPHAPTVGWALACVCLAAFAHQALCATLLALPSDLMPKPMLATSFGLTGCVGFCGVIVSNFIIGALAARGHYGPIFTALAFLDLIAAAIIWFVVVSPNRQITV